MPIKNRIGERETKTNVNPLCPHPSLLLRIKFTHGAFTSSLTKLQCGYPLSVPVHGLWLDKHLHTVCMGCRLISVLVPGETPPTPALTLVSAGLFCSHIFTLHPITGMEHFLPFLKYIITRRPVLFTGSALKSSEAGWDWFSLWGWILFPCHTRHPGRSSQSLSCHLIH